MEEIKISITIDEEELQTLKENRYIETNYYDEVYNAIHCILLDLKNK